MLEWLPLFLIHEEEQRKKREIPDYESPYDIDITLLTWRVVLIGIGIGLSPFILAAIVIGIVKWIK